MTSIDGYPIDSSIEERLSFESDVTKFPIEKGAPVADHIIPGHIILELDGVVSDTPIGAIANDPTRTSLVGAMSPSRDMYERFVQLRDERRAIIVDCSYGKFDEMVLVSLTATKDKATVKAFKFTAKFEQIEIRENNRTSIRVAVPGAGGRQNLGFLGGTLSDIGGAKLVFSRAVDSGTRDRLLKQGFRILLTSTHDQRAAANNGFDLWQRTGLGPTSAMDHYEAQDSGLSDGFVAGRTYRPFVDGTQPITWDQQTGQWHNKRGEAASRAVPDPKAWSNITNTRRVVAAGS